MRQMIEKARGAARHRNKLGDFTADRRVLLLIGMALVVGSASAVAAWVLSEADRAGHQSGLVRPSQQRRVFRWRNAQPRPSGWCWRRRVGGLVIGLMARFGSEKIRGHGIPEAIEAILIGGSRMQPKVAILKPLSSAISIGTGGPFGAEGPIIMTGGAIGSLFAQCFHLTAAERKTLLVAGAAAGMTAIFGTPIAAVLLAVELLLFEWKPRSFLPGGDGGQSFRAVWRPLLFGTGPLFPFAEQPDLPWWGLAAAVGVGIVAGLQSGLMTRLLYAAEDLFDHLPVHWMWWPALGGLVVGLGGLIDPRALGVGYDVIADLLSGHMVRDEAIRLLLVKSAIWVSRWLRHLGRRAGAAADPRRHRRLAGGPGAARRRIVLGAGRHGRDDGRHDALAADRRDVRHRADRQYRHAAAAAGGDRRGACRHRAAAQALDPDREDRPPRPAHHARIRDRSVRADARRPMSWSRMSTRCRSTCPVDAAVAFFTVGSAPSQILSRRRRPMGGSPAW